MTEPPFSRRDLLRLGLVGGSGLLAGACGWNGGRLEPGLRAVSRLNDWTGEHLFQSSRRLARQYDLAERTPARLFPAYSRTRPAPRLGDEAAWALEVGGLVRKPARLTLEVIAALPRITYTVKHHCVEGWTAIATWTGVPVSVVADLVAPTGEARYLRFDSFDAAGAYFNGWDLESAMHPQTMLAYAFNDGPLGPEHGAPLRLYSPLKLGYKLTKYLTRMSFTAERPGGYWEDRGYPWFAGV